MTIQDVQAGLAAYGYTADSANNWQTVLATATTRFCLSLVEDDVDADKQQLELEVSPLGKRIRVEYFVLDDPDLFLKVAARIKHYDAPAPPTNRTPLTGPEEF